jgi:hypothetical protein
MPRASVGLGVASTPLGPDHTNVIIIIPRSGPVSGGHVLGERRSSAEQVQVAPRLGEYWQYPKLPWRGSANASLFCHI